MNKLIVFDLDGTLNQTENYAVPAMLSALKDFGVECFNKEDIIDTIGAKDEDTIVRFFGAEAEKYETIFWKRVNEYVVGEYIDRYSPYDGTERLLKCLKASGYTLAVCSNADMAYITKTLKLLGIDMYFDAFQAVIPGKTKADSLKALLERVEPQKAYMVGDRYFDMEAAKANHIPFAGCLYGYGGAEELEGSDALLEKPEDLIIFLRAQEADTHVLVLDLDGTLTNSDKEITPYTKSVLFDFMEKGGIIVLASGRPTYGIMPVANALELEKRGGYILSYNGGCITECKTGEVIYMQPLDRADVKILARQAKTYKVNIIAYEDDHIITENAGDIYAQKESMITKMAIQQVGSFENYVEFPAVKCLMTAEADYLAGVEESMKAFWGDKLSICRSEPFFLEVTAKGIDKAKSLGRLLDVLGMDRTCMIACGDGFNDKSMIEYAGIGVAMDNAQDAVKASADYITASNDEDGVAQVVEKLMAWHKIRVS